MINIVFNTSRRFDLFHETLISLIEKNEGIEKIVKHVYILDHLSSYSDRKKMIDLCRIYFKEKVTLFEFNGVEPFDYVDKLNSIQHIFEYDEIILFIEDDWKCIEELNLSFYVEKIRQREFDIINFSTPLHIQNDDIIQKYRIDNNFWKNPFPEFYNSPYEMKNGYIMYNVVRMKNFSLTPHITLSDLYKGKEFVKNQNYEVNYADSYNFKQLFTNEMYFQHIGNYKSLETHK